MSKFGHHPLAAKASPTLAEELHELLGRVGDLLRLWQARHAYRRELREQLLTQPDSVLRDAGWTRAAVAVEAGKRFWQR